MSLNSFFGYYGGKYLLAPRYDRPRHDTIIEPFAGAAGYATRHHHKRVILVDRNPIIVGIWRYLLRAAPREILALPTLEPGQLINDLPTVPQEARWLMGFWVNNAVSAPCQQLSQWAMRQPHSHWGRTIRARIASQVEKIRHWQIIEGTYADAPDIEATWFIDPPYETAGSHYPCGSDAIDFPALGEWCRARRGQVMVCENEGATWMPFRPFRVVQSASRRVGETRADAVSREAIWTNDEAAA